MRTPKEQEEFDRIYGHWPMLRSCQYLCVGKDSPLACESFVTLEQNIAVGFLPREVAEGNPKIVGIPYEGTKEKVIELFWRKDRFLFSAPKNFIRMAKEVFPAAKL